MQQRVVSGSTEASPSAVVVRRLRNELGLSQVKLAAKAGLGRLDVVAAEMGRSQCTSARMCAGLAMAFGLCFQDMREALTGAISPDEAVQRMQGARAASAERASASLTTLDNDALIAELAKRLTQYAALEEK